MTWLITYLIGLIITTIIYGIVYYFEIKEKCKEYQHELQDAISTNSNHLFFPYEPSFSHKYSTSIILIVLWPLVVISFLFHAVSSAGQNLVGSCTELNDNLNNKLLKIYANSAAKKTVHDNKVLVLTHPDKDVRDLWSQYGDQVDVKPDNK